MPYFRAEELTRNDITGIHSVVVLNESETIHELDLGDVAGAMGLEMILDIFFGDWSSEKSGQRGSRSKTSVGLCPLR